MELASLGRAYLAALTPQRRTQLLQFLHNGVSSGKLSSPRSGKRAPTSSHKASAPRPGSPRWFALATPLEVEGTIYALNVSLSTQESIDTIAQDLGPSLLGLARAVRHELVLQEPRG